MADTTITQAMVDLAGGEAVAAFAVGKTRSQFATAMVAVLEVALAGAAVQGAGIVSYTIAGRSVSRSVDQARSAIAYFKGVASAGEGGGGGFLSLPIEFRA